MDVAREQLDCAGEVSVGQRNADVVDLKEKKYILETVAFFLV